ncbi:MAG: hypothetical protein IPG23_11460 [Burkholderiales bacterium]|nr:hypothetical protein [Burkholderiales bacterium]
MEIRFENVDENTRRIYERFFFERICSMSVASRQDFTIPLLQVEGLYFTSVQDTVERLTELSGRVSTFQWRNCIFAPISRSTKPKEVNAEIFSQLKAKVPSLFVRSYVYLIFIKFESSDTSTLDFGEGIQPVTICPSFDDFQIYYWNTKYEVKPGRKKNLFGDSGADTSQHRGAQVGELDGDDVAELEASPEKLFIVQNPAHELQRIQDANSDIIDAFRAFNNELPLVDQTRSYLEKITEEIDKNLNTRILVEGPARSGKTVLAMSLLAKYPKSKMLLMNWYFYDALIDAFKIWAELSADEIEQLFSMPQDTEKLVTSERGRLIEFRACQSDTRLLDVALRAIDASINPRHQLPKWAPYIKGYPTPQGKEGDEWRAKPVIRSNVGDLIPVINNARVMKIVEVVEIYDDYSAAFRDVTGLKDFTIANRDQLLEYKSEIEAGRGDHYIAKILKNIADALHNSTQRFFHHDLEQTKGCWIERGNPTTCNITNQDLIICDEVQRLGVIPKIYNRDRFDETKAIFENSRQSFLCGDDFQMLNPIYDQGIGPIERVAGKDISRLKLPDSIGVPAEVGQLIKYLLGEHTFPERNSGFDIQLLYSDDIGFVKLFDADGSTKKHYAIPSNSGFYRNEPYILRTEAKTVKCTDKCGPYCEHKRISMLTEDLRQKFKFFCSEAVMPNFALSAYELISREVESVYLKIPEEIDLEIVRQPISRQSDNQAGGRNWKKQHLYVLMTRATMRLVVNVEDRALYEDLFKRLRRVNVG